MSTSHNYDLIDGREVAPLVIKEDYVLTGVHTGSVYVEAGHFLLRGTIQGSLAIQPGTTAEISGEQQGSVSIHGDALVTVSGAIQGSVFVDHGATLLIEATGKLAGSLSNHGTVIVRGVFGGHRSGRGGFRLENDGYIKQPVVRDGINYYNW